MARPSFPVRIETGRLRFERVSHDDVDVDELVALFTRDGWRDETMEHMPWFRFEDEDDVESFVDHAEQQWREGERARYLLRSADEGGAIVGTASFDPDWDRRCGGSDIVLAKQYWGQGYGTERGSVFVELSFGHYDFDAYVTSCAVDNAPSRRMIEKLVAKYGGKHEGVLRQFGSPHPDGTVTDQHRFSITREEYARATGECATLEFEIQW